MSKDKQKTEQEYEPDELTKDLIDSAEKITRNSTKWF